MTPKRWQHIGQVYYAAPERVAEQCIAYLNENYAKAQPLRYAGEHFYSQSGWQLLSSLALQADAQSISAPHHLIITNHEIGDALLNEQNDQGVTGAKLPLSFCAANGSERDYDA